jgi:hypothetical protein
VSVLEEFVAERTERGREKIKRSVGKRESIVKSKVALPAKKPRFKAFHPQLIT